MDGHYAPEVTLLLSLDARIIYLVRRFTQDVQGRTFTKTSSSPVFLSTTAVVRLLLVMLLLRYLPRDAVRRTSDSVLLFTYLTLCGAIRVDLHLLQK